jgi:hypothetical protein
VEEIESLVVEATVNLAGETENLVENERGVLVWIVNQIQVQKSLVRKGDR